MPPYYPQGTITPKLGLSLIGQDEVLADNFIILDAFASTGAVVGLGISGGNTLGTTGTSGGVVYFQGGNNITLSGNANTIVIQGGAGGGGGGGIAASLSGNTSGALALVSSGTLILAGGNNITLSQNGQSVTVSGPNTVAQSVQTQNLVDLSLSGNTSGVLALISSGTAILAGGNNITLSQNGQSVTISAASQTVQTQGSVLINGSSGSIVFTAGANISLSQNASTITISAPDQSVQTQNLVDVSLSGNTSGTLALVSSGTLTLVGGNNITLSQVGNAVTISGQRVVFVDISGNTSGTTAHISSGTMTLVGGNNITLSQVGNVITISGPNTSAQSVQTQNLVSINGSTGNISLVAGNNISLSQNASTITISASNQSVQSLGIYGSSQTVGQSSSSTYDARSLSLVGQGIVSVGWSNSSLLISASVAAQTAQSIGVYASSQTVGQSSSSTVDARSFTHVGQGIISVGLSGGSLLISATTAAQTNQSAGIYGSSQTVGQSSSSTYDARSLSLVGQGIVSVGWSNSSLLISATTAQSNQSAGIYASSQTVGQSSSSTYDARSLSLVGQGIVSVGWSNSSLLISATTAQSVQTLGIYASSQTLGTTSSTHDARSLSVVGSGIVSVGWSNSSLIISAPAGGGAGFTGGISGGNTSGNTGTTGNEMVLAGGNNITLSGSTAAGGMTVTISGPNTVAQTVQTQDLVDVSLSGNTSGALALISSGTAILAGGNNITLSQNGQSVTISAFTQTVQTQNLVDISLSGNTAGALALVSSGTAILAGGNNITLSQNGQSITILDGMGTLSQWMAAPALATNASSGLWANIASMTVWPVFMPGFMSATQANFYVSVSASTSSNSSYAAGFTVNLFIFTRNGSTLNSASSGQGTLAFTMTSSNSVPNVSGFRALTIPINANFTPGNYWVGASISSASTNTNWVTVSSVQLVAPANANFLGVLGVASANSVQVALGQGVVSLAGSSAISFGAITGTASPKYPMIQFLNITA